MSGIGLGRGELVYCSEPVTQKSQQMAHSCSRPIADIEVFEVTAGQPTYAEIHNHGRNDRLRAYQYSK
jgi:hypothetical protein